MAQSDETGTFDPLNGTSHSDCLGVNTTFEFNTTNKWLGLDAYDTSHVNLQSDLQGLVLVIVLLGLQMCVRYRQKHRRATTGRPEPAEGVIFPDVPPEKFDDSLVNCWKSLFNYGFYKFGLEVSMAMMALAALVRMDFVGALLLVWLVVFIWLPRRGCRRLWPLFVVYLAVMFPMQVGCNRIGPLLPDIYSNPF